MLVPNIFIQMSLWILTAESRKTKSKLQGRKKKAVYTCKDPHVKQWKQWEGSAGKQFGINPDLLRLGIILEVIIQSNKEKAMGRTKWESDISLALIFWGGFFTYVRDCPSQSMKDEGQGNASECGECGGVFIESRALPRHSALLVEVPLTLFKGILFSQGCAS